MSERLVNISFPVKENILISLKASKDEFTKEILFSSALMLYRKRRLSLGKAAELSGYTKIEFIEKLNKEKEYIFDYTDEEVDEIFKDVEKIK